jgi:hypothetical protein
MVRGYSLMAASPSTRGAATVARKTIAETSAVDIEPSVSAKRVRRDMRAFGRFGRPTRLTLGCFSIGGPLGSV